MSKFSLYIHIPFCEKKCYYCDFVSFPGKEQVSLYMDNIIKELALYKDRLSSYEIDTIFIGGGTPTSIEPEYIASIMDYIYQNYKTNHIQEITIEANPGTIDQMKAYIYKQIGINRISMGLQSLNNNLLKSIGRIHSSEEFISSYKLLRSTGFDNINIDLMLGLPCQTIDDLINSIDGVINLGANHISLYSLIIEDNTILNKWYKKGLLELPSEDMDREMYHKAVELLENKGYKQYEISNFAKPAYECKHNLIYWKVKPYLGLGLSSHSNLFNKRFWNTSNLKFYNDILAKGKSPIEGEEIIPKDVELVEYLILGLRLNDGIIKEEFKSRFNIELDNIYRKVIDKHVKGGLLYEDEKSIKLTKMGRDLSNMVELDFMP
ncbi:oxygen-independent coproporphyrinogen III oxidase [Tissierella creatinini]|nr:oxygen-independent coproporphyrinogen III oxidase [Tissierella creatinini]TJX67182.1 oxygen-independent coproporphyrinogen III oxidase [Soehngenia saccharolytica]